MPRTDRRTTLARFSSGEVEIVTNCAVLTEGFDEPRIDCIIMARPTQSRLLYAQMVGRGTRLHPEKSDLLVIDVADNTRKHTLVGLHALFDLHEGLDLRGANALETAHKLRTVAERYPWVDIEKVTSPEDLELIAERIDLFRFAPPEEVEPHTRLSWCAAPGSGYRLGLPEREAVVIKENLLDAWEIRLSSPKGKQEELLLGTAADLPAAIRKAEDFVRREKGDAVRMLDRFAAWRGQPPSEAQLETLRRRRIPAPKGLTRGQASWMIAMLTSRRR
jgi:hypothetical protein